MKPDLTIELLRREAANFSQIKTRHNEPSLYGVTDGKRVGTYLEHKFQQYLDTRFIYEKDSSAKGIDFPTLKVDIKVTSVKQP